MPLMDLPDTECIGTKLGLVEVPGGIGVDSCASDNVSMRSMFAGLGYAVQPSPGSQRKQRWGSASGHSIQNEGQIQYRFLTEEGTINKGTTQIGSVQRPLTAVSKISEAGNMSIFCDANGGSDYIISLKDPVAQEILKLVAMVKKKTKIYKHRGTYRMRAWVIPEGAAGDKIASQVAPFVRQGA